MMPERSRTVKRRHVILSEAKDLVGAGERSFGATANADAPQDDAIA
jgi:hypothetical protein